MVATNAVAPSIGSASIRILPDITGFGPQLSRELGQRAPLITAALGAAMVAPLAASIGAAIEFEDTFAAVRKTVEGTEQELDQLALTIREMATEIPVTTNELNAIASAAGQLGVSVQDLDEFTEVIAKLGVAAESIDPATAATELARFSNITGGSLDNVDKLGAAIVDLGNKFPSTEAEILHFSQLIAGAGTVLGLSQADILGFSNALASAGIRAERGGSAISQLIMQLQNAVATGSPKLDTFAGLIGVTTEEFQSLAASDPSEVLIQVVENFGRLSDTAPADAVQVLDDLSLNTIRTRDVMLRLGIASEVVRDSVETSNTAFREGTALNVEAEKRFATLASQLQVFGNTLREIGIVVGNALAPAVEFLVDIGTDFLDFLRDIPAPVLATVTVVAALSGGLLVLGSAFLYSVQFVARLLALFGPVRAAAGGLIPLFKSMALSMTTFGTQATVASGSLQAVRASATVATGAMSTFLTTILPLVAIAAAVAGAIYLINRRMDEVDESSATAAEATEDLTSSLGLATDEVENFSGALGDLPDNTQVSVSFKMENQQAINMIRSLSEEGAAAFGAQVALDLLIEGVAPEEAIEAMRRLFGGAGIKLPVGLEFENAQDVVDFVTQQGTEIANSIVEMINIDPRQTFGTDPISRFFDLRNQRILDTIQTTADTISQIAIEVGDPDAAIQFWQDFEAAVRSSNLPIETQNDALKVLAERVIESTGVTGADADAVRDRASAMLEMAEAQERLEGVNPFAQTNLLPRVPESLELSRIQSEVDRSAQAITGSIQTTSVAWIERQQEMVFSSVTAQKAIAEANAAIVGDQEAITEAFQAGIPILQEYSSEVELNLEEATQSILDYVQDEAMWTQLRQILVGNLSEGALEAIESLSLPERAAFAEAILGDDESARTAALNYISLISAAFDDPSVLEGLSMDDFNLFGEGPLTPDIPEIVIDSPIRIPPEVREDINSNVLTMLEEAFAAEGKTAVFDNAADVYRTAGDVAKEAYLAGDSTLASAIFASLATVSTLPSDVRDDMVELGSQLAGGIATGFREYGLSQALVPVVRSAVTAVRRSQYIESPSRLWAEQVGLPMAQGVAVGFREGGKEIDNAVNSVLTLPEPPSMSGFGNSLGSSGSGLTQNITINNPQTEDLETSTKKALATARTAVLLSRPAHGLRRK